MWDQIEHRGKAWRGAAIVGGLVVATVGYGVWRIYDVDARRAAAPRIQVGLVQPNEQVKIGVQDLAADRDRLTAMQLASMQLERAGADLVVWSESAYPMDLPRD